MVSSTVTVVAGLNTPDWSNLCSPVGCESPSLATLGRCVTEVHTLFSVLVQMGTKEGAFIVWLMLFLDCIGANAAVEHSTPMVIKLHSAAVAQVSVFTQSSTEMKQVDLYSLMLAISDDTVGMYICM